jgi:hypothetical protein
MIMELNKRPGPSNGLEEPLKKTAKLKDLLKKQ